MNIEYFKYSPPNNILSLSIDNNIFTHLELCTGEQFSNYLQLLSLNKIGDCLKHYKHK